MKLRILLADDHAVLRSGLKMMINAQWDMQVVAEASDGAEAVALAKREKPHVVVMDLGMAGLSGTTATAQIVRAAPQVRVLVLTMHTDPSYLRAAMTAGAGGYIAKNSADIELLAAIRAVSQGRTFLDRSFDPALVADVLGTRRERGIPKAGRALHLLSPREREVFGLVAQGYTNQQVAEQLKLSVKSVETYRARCMNKLMLETRTEVLQFALDSGVLVPGQTASKR